MQPRRSPRKRVHHTGYIIFEREGFHGPAQVKLPCNLIDLSETGAKISGAILHALPEYFTLEVKSISLNELVRLRWKIKQEIGVSFNQPISFEALKIDPKKIIQDESRQKLRRIG